MTEYMIGRNGGLVQKELILPPGAKARHPKCEGYWSHTQDGSEFTCGYRTTLDCEDCKYGMGRKDPQAKCNQVRES